MFLEKANNQAQYKQELLSSAEKTEQNQTTLARNGNYKEFIYSEKTMGKQIPYMKVYAGRDDAYVYYIPTGEKYHFTNRNEAFAFANNRKQHYTS